MYERKYGYRYDESKDDSATDIAKRIRADIKQAIAEGLLPDRWKYSVRTRYASMCQSIDLDVKNCADAWQPCDGTVPGSKYVWEDGATTATACPNIWCKARNDPERAAHATEHDVLTEEARAAKMTLERIHGAYNHDGSDAMVDYFDVNYYGHVSFQDARSAEFEASEKARLKARKKEREGVADRRVVAVYRRDGTRMTHWAVEVDGKVRLLCGARLSTNSALGFAEGQDVQCSRCAKKGGVR